MLTPSRRSPNLVYVGDVVHRDTVLPGTSVALTSPPMIVRAVVVDAEGHDYGRLVTEWDDGAQSILPTAECR